MQITFRNLEPSEAIKANILKKAEKLEHFAEHIISFRVLVEAPHKHHHKGNLYNVKVEISLPGEEILATHHTGKHHAHEDVYVAIRDAFDATRRQLKNYVRRHQASMSNNISLHHLNSRHS